MGSLLFSWNVLKIWKYYGDVFPQYRVESWWAKTCCLVSGTTRNNKARQKLGPPPPQHTSSCDLFNHSFNHSFFAKFQIQVLPQPPYPFDLYEKRMQNEKRSAIPTSQFFVEIGGWALAPLKKTFFQKYLYKMNEKAIYPSIFFSL